MHSTTYLRPTKRQSYWVLVHYEEALPGGSRGFHTVYYMAKILFFVKAKAATCPDLKLAICELYKVQQQAGTVGTLWHTSCLGRPTHHSYAVLFEENEMGSKHVLARPPNCTNAWFIPYGNMSGADRSF
jgi:hypothetical protein